MGSVKKPRNESNKATLARVKKQMAKPRIVKSAKKGRVNPQVSHWPRHNP